MWRVMLLLLAIAVAAPAQQIKLYLKEGGYHMVREYKVEGDRVKYYSTERADWEEIPLDLVDLKQTESQLESRKAEDDKKREIDAAEDKFEKEQRAELAQIPAEPGVYYFEGGKMMRLKQAEVKVQSSKGRTILKMMAPIPIVSGKSTLEADGLTAAIEVPLQRPYFYFLMADTERLALVKLEPVQKRKARLIENWEIMPVTNELMTERKEVQLFRHQIQGNLFKIWPQKPLEPGEYAVVEYTEGKGNTLVWDFRVPANAKPD